MGTEKRERQKANRAKKVAAETRQAKSEARKRGTVRVIVGLAAALAAVLVIAWAGGAFDGDGGDDVVPTLPPVVTTPSDLTASDTAGDAPTATDTSGTSDTTDTSDTSAP